MKAHHATGLALALALASSAATAQAATTRDQPPSWGAWLRTGPFQPHIGNAEQRAVYDVIYGLHSDVSFNNPFMTTLEVAYYHWREFGLLGFYAQGGLWRTSAATRVCVGDPLLGDECTPETVLTSTKGKDTTALELYPLGVGLVYRFNLLERRLQVPLVPYGKVGFDYVFWRNTTGTGQVSRREGLRGAGATYGIEVAGGLAIDLNPIDPSATARARATLGLTNTYLFGQATYMQVNNFGDTSRLDLSGLLVQAGLGLEFL